MFLTANELRELTGRVRPTAQIAWLRRYRWRLALDADGRPKVARAYYERRMVTDEEAPKSEARPDFAAISTRA